jgi:hypothetical protein
MRLRKLHKTPPTSWLFSRKPRGCRRDVDDNSLIYNRKKLVAGVGFEPTTFGL